MPSKNGMTVSDLKEQLSQYPDDTLVYLTYDYGDHWHSQVAKAISSVEEGAVKFSAYHSMNKVDDEADENNAILLA